MKKLAFILAIAFVGVPTIHAADFISGANSWVESRMAGSSVPGSAFFFLFLGGLLASLLPCVYPLYPITAQILRGRAGGGGAKWVHPVTYYLGLSAIYFGFGFIAAISGGAFNQVLRLPETNLGLSFLFLLLALSTSGFIYLSFLGGGGSQKEGKGVAGTFLMGMGAGLLSSSCVGPFVVSILIKIADASDHLALAAICLAALKMLAFGCGLGLPLLAVALFGVRLPRSGTWMQWVQYALGLVILYFSYVYCEKGLTTLGFPEEKARVAFIGAIALLVAVYRLQSEEVDSPKRTARALAGLLLAVGFFCMQHGLSQEATAATATSIQTNGIPQENTGNFEKKGNLLWDRSFEHVKQTAQSEGKPIFIDFSAHWCANCKEFDKLTQSNAKFNEALAHVALCKIQDTDPDFKKFQSDSRFPELKVGLPFLVVMDAKGNLLFKTSDYTQVENMMMFME